MLTIIRSKETSQIAVVAGSKRNTVNGDHLNNIRHEASRHFRNEKRECLKDKIDELATNSKNKNIRGVTSLEVTYGRRRMVNGGLPPIASSWRQAP
jgi:hypothetical protein